MVCHIFSKLLLKAVALELLIVGWLRWKILSEWIVLSTKQATPKMLLSFHLGLSAEWTHHCNYPLLSKSLFQSRKQPPLQIQMNLQQNCPLLGVADGICQKNLQERRTGRRILLLCPLLIVVFGLLFRLVMVDVQVFSFVISLACYCHYCRIYFEVFAKLNILHILCLQFRYFNMLDCLIQLLIPLSS